MGLHSLALWGGIYLLTLLPLIKLEGIGGDWRGDGEEMERGLEGMLYV